MDLIDEKDVSLIQAREDRSEIAFTFQHRSGSHPQAHLQLMRDDPGEGRFPQPGRRVKEAVIERFFTPPGRLDEDAQVLFHALLSHKLVQALRAERLFKRLFFRSGLSHEWRCFNRAHESCLSASLIKSAVLASTRV